ncbi:MAG: hypothetical protein KKA31_01655 [Candidatus Margulisbacteria bacterium]|nr:hypothetical protein [Candidatus Margulisiibacteriota bacterium]
MKKPKELTEEHLVFLDGLRGSGITNMFGARPYLMKRFKKLNSTQANEILIYWMDTFAERQKNYSQGT